MISSSMGLKNGYIQWVCIFFLWGSFCNCEKVWDAPIVTEIVAINNYFEAEDYHHDYFENNPGNPYCQSVVRPKVEKFRKVFAARLN